MKSGSTDALARAVVELRRDDDLETAIASTSTEADGRFALPNVPAGRYRLVTTRAGYVSRSTPLAIAAGRSENTVVTMSATGAISGRVSGQNGEPLGNIEVAAMRVSYQTGRRSLTAVQAVRSNDRGEYRLFWLAPGRYLVRATHPAAQTGVMTMLGAGRVAVGFQIGGGFGPNGLFEMRGSGDPTLIDAFGPGGDLDAEQYVPVYFPGAVDDQGAAAIELRAGAEVAAIDVPVLPIREHHVRGVVINGATGQAAQYAGLQELTADAPAGSIGGIGRGLSNNGQPPINEDGSFDVTLRPGRHLLKGTAGTGIGYVSIDVRDADVDGVRIVAMPEFNINGSIAADAPVDAAAFGTLRVSLRRELPVPVPPPSYSLPRPDGRFTASAAPGDYRVSLAPFLMLPPVFPSGVVRVPKGLENAYVKSVRLGGVDALNNGVHFDGPPASSLEIVLGMHPGSVEGAVRHGAPSGAAGLTVTLLPNLRSRFDLIRTGATDAAGLFRIDRVPPGEYRVFAWDEVNDGDWNDPDFIRAYEDRGVPVHVGDDGAATRVQLAAIPVQR